MRRRIVTVAVALFALGAFGDTYTWKLAAGYAWDTNICWAGGNPSNQYGFPNVATDVAIINSLRTNSAGNLQIWPNQFDNYLRETTVGQWFLSMSNDLTFGAGDDSEPNGFFFVNNGADSRLCFSNIYMDNGWWNHSLDLRFATYYVLSNDLRVTLASVPDGAGNRDYAVLWIVDDTIVFGDHSIIVDGAGRMIVGMQYSDTLQYSNPKILTTKPTIVDDAVLDVNHNAVFAAPVHLTDVGPYDTGYFRQYGEESTDVDISFLGGYCLANWTGIAGITNFGDMVCHGQGNFYIGYWPGSGDTDYRKAIFPGTLSGTNYVINWHFGDSSFTGVVSPGTGTSEYNIGWLYFVRWTNGFLYVGRPEAPARLDIEINGMGDEPGVDNDIVYFEGQPYLTLSNMNLHVYVGQNDPNKTNLILYSYDHGVQIGQFRSVTWHPANMEGTVIYSDNAVQVTGTHDPSQENPQAPTNVAASDGTHTDRVRVSWNTSSGATKYRVYRNTNDSSGGSADVSGEVVSPPFEDITAALGQMYYYWVKAGNSNGWSDFSGSDTGYRLAPPFDAGILVYGFNTNTLDGWVGTKRGALTMDETTKVEGTASLRLDITNAIGNWANPGFRNPAIDDAPWELNSNLVAWIRASDAVWSNSLRPYLVFGLTYASTSFAYEINADGGDGHITLDDQWHPYSFAYDPAWLSNATALTLSFQVTTVGSPIGRYYHIDNVRLLPGIRQQIVITNKPTAPVDWSPPSYALAGTNLGGIVGFMWVSNAANSEVHSFVAATAWTAPAVSLVVGENQLYVYGTNAAGVVDYDWLTITRLGVGTGVPFVDITNADSCVTYDGTSTSIGGTNNIHVVGRMKWTNTLTGAGAWFNASNSWLFGGIALGVGSNLIVVTGTNAYGVATNDSVRITRGVPGTGVPFVDVTNPVTVLTYDATRYAVAGTNNANVVGAMFAVNALSGDSAWFDASAGWVTPELALAVGANQLIVNGTNLHGQSSEDHCIIVRGPAGTGSPFVDVTNADAVVGYDTQSFSVSGTNNANIVGAMCASNAANGAVVTFAAAMAWAAPAINLETGANHIVVHGTNVYGAAATDAVTITRGGMGTGMPLIDVTTTPAVVSYTMTSIMVAGTNNMHVEGGMWWSNAVASAGGAVERLASSGSWTVVSAGLAVGTNSVSVYGTNAWGWLCSDTAAVYRKTWAESAPKIATNALLFPSAGSVLDAEAVTAVVWNASAIVDDLDGSNLVVTAISACPEDALAQATLITNNVGNLLGEIAWMVPETLVGGNTNYVIRFEVTDSSSLTNSMVFTSNPFTVVPEPLFIWSCLLVVALDMRKRN